MSCYTFYISIYVVRNYHIYWNISRLRSDAIGCWPRIPTGRFYFQKMSVIYVCSYQHKWTWLNLPLFSLWGFNVMIIFLFCFFYVYRSIIDCLYLYISQLAVPYLRRLVAGFPPRRPGFEPRSSHGGFMVDKVALGQVFSEYLCFPCQFSFHRLLHTHHHLSSEAGIIGQIVADVPSGLSVTPPKETK
jgi:hypothetical protein